MAGVAQLVEALSPKLRGRGFDSQSAHMPRLPAWSPGGVQMRGNQSMFLSLSISLHSPLSKISKHVLGRG